MNGPVVTISRQHGSGGEEVAALIAERLGVPLLDEEIRRRASERAGVSERVLEEAERPVSWVTRILERLGSVGVMSDGAAVETTAAGPVPTSETFRQLMDDVVREVAEDGAVIVGHGAHVVLKDRPGVVRVFVQAPLEARIQRLVHEADLSPVEARRQAETWDRERVRFYQDAYHVNWFDLRLYDCLVDTHLLGIHGAAETIVQMAERVCVARPEATPATTAPQQPAAAPEPTRHTEGETIPLKNGQVRIRPMSGGDAPALLTFFRSLPPEDLLFLRRNVTDSAVIDAWERDVVDGRMFTLLAESDVDGGRPEVVGEASLRPSDVPWTRHIGEVRVVTSPGWRGRGLGTALLREILRAAHDAGIEKVTAESLAEQSGAREMLSRLGFVEEGRYAGYARDLSGAPHDLIVMTHTEPVTEAVMAH